jgi:hypothetical protein
LWIISWRIRESHSWINRRVVIWRNNRLPNLHWLIRRRELITWEVMRELSWNEILRLRRDNLIMRHVEVVRMASI